MAVFSAITLAVTTISTWTISLGTLGTFAIGNFLLQTAVSLGVSALAKAFAGKPDAPGAAAEAFAINGRVRTGGVVPRSFLLGPSMTAGSLAWHTEWGKDGDTKNAYYTQVIALSDMPVKGLREWWLDGRKMTLSGSPSGRGTTKGPAALEYRDEKGKDHAWIRFHDGNQRSADSFLTTVVSPRAPRRYSRKRVGKGIAYAVVTFRVNDEMFTGFPRSKFVLDGMDLYDISKDSTRGGKGAQRWNTPATWGGDGDALPAVQAYNLARGIRYNGAWFYGMQGVTEARLPAAHWIAQIHKCRARVKGRGGAMEPIYRCAGEITVDSEIGSAFDALMTSCAGRMSEVGGAYKIYVGAPDAPITGFTDDDIVSLAPQTFTPFFGLSDTVNGVIATFPSPGEGYEQRSTRPLYRPDYEVQDGGRRLMTEVQLPFVPFPVQVQRLMRGEMKAARRARRHTFTLPARFQLIEPGAVVTWTSARNGYGAKQFRVDGVLDLPNCDLVVDLTEVDPTDHGSFDFDAEYDPVVPSDVVPVRPTAQGVIGFTATPADIKDSAAAARRPGILLRWNGTVEDIAGIMFEIRLKSSAQVVARPETRDFETGELLVEAGLVAKETYQLRAKYIPGHPRAVTWTGWVEVTTNDVRLTSRDIKPAALDWSVMGQEVRDQIDAAGDARASATASDAARILADAAAAKAAGSEGAAHESQTLAATSATAAAKSQAASVASERGARVHRDKAGAHAVAAKRASVAADTARATAVVAADTAALAKTGAESAASAARGSKLAADTAAVARTGAESAASGAVFARDVASRVYAASAFANPILANWGGAKPAGILVYTDGGAAMEKRSDGKYGNALRLGTGSRLSANRPAIRMDADIGQLDLPAADDIAGLRVGFELSLVSGLWGSSHVRVRWEARGRGGTSVDVNIDLAGELASGRGVVQSFIRNVSRPAGYVAGSAPGILRVYIYGSSNIGGRTRRANVFDLHSVAISVLNTGASALVQQKAISDLEGNAEAAIGLRVVSGTEGRETAEMELVSLSDPTGASVSSARISADAILLDGSVRARQMVIDERLEIDAQDAGFSMDKTGVGDFVRDGLYMGRHLDARGAASFGFFMGRSAGGKEEYIRLTKEDGLKIKNAEYLIGSGKHTQAVYTSSRTVSLRGKTGFTAQLVGGGGGRGGTSYTGSGGGLGSSGGTTTVKLYDGRRLIATWTARGGARGASTHSGAQPAQISPLSPYGNSGKGGTRGRQVTRRFHERTGDVNGEWRNGKYGDNGARGSTRTIPPVNLAHMTDPKLVITVGARGTGGSGSGTSRTSPNTDGTRDQEWKGGSGGHGTAGAVKVQTLTDSFVSAGPVALAVTARGSFSRGTGRGSFPNIQPGRGLWTVWNGSGTWQVEVAPGKSINCNDYSATFVASQRPRWTRSLNSRTISYAFWAM